MNPEDESQLTNGEHHLCPRCDPATIEHSIYEAIS
jgi:hypothetical protein